MTKKPMKRTVTKKPMKRTEQTETIQTQPKLTKTQQVELLAARMYERDVAQAAETYKKSGEKIDAWIDGQRKKVKAALIIKATVERINLYHVPTETSPKVTFQLHAQQSVNVPKEMLKHFQTYSDVEELANAHATWAEMLEHIKKSYNPHMEKGYVKEYRAKAREHINGTIANPDLTQLLNNKEVQKVLDDVIDNTQPVTQIKLLK